MKSLPSDMINIICGRASPSYIIGGESIAIIDVCFPSDAKNILTFVHHTLGRDLNDIKLIILTHSHLDHVNGVDYLSAKIHAELAAHSNAEKYLTGKQANIFPGMHKAINYISFMMAHNLPRPSISDAFRMPWSGIPGIRKGIHSKITHWLTDDEDLPYNPGWKVIHTLGHTDDSICLYNSQNKALISGDILINLDGRLMLNPLLSLDSEALIESLNKLKQLQVDVVYPGWGTPVFGKDILDCVSMERLDK
jgi:glyoxylase-like metal-dependent hydrolase (beta-lactamase superfamily II)